MDARHKRRLQRLIKEAYDNWQTYAYVANHMGMTGDALTNFSEKAREYHAQYVQLKKYLLFRD